MMEKKYLLFVNMKKEYKATYSIYVISPQCGFHMNCCSLTNIEDATQLLCIYGKMLGVQWIANQDFDKSNNCCRRYSSHSSDNSKIQYGYTASIHEHRYE